MTQDKLKVLLIEHDSGFARYVGEMLGQARDFTADIVSTPELSKGLAALDEDHFDVIMMDVSVPDGAGLANVTMLQSGAPEVPVVVAGDSDDEALALQAVQAG